jgi:folylpolyglutamate synthase
LRSNSKDAIKTLNKLQSNAAQIAHVIRTGEQDRDFRMKEIESCLRLLEISLDDLDTLSVIHVSGTKGKGSVCAMVESILRHSSLKTGLFTLDHLLCVVIRIM